MPSKKTFFRLFILLSSTTLWIAAGVYAVYINSLRLEQYKLIRELRELRKENNDLYLKISEVLNYKTAKEFATKEGYVPIKPYRVINFLPILKDKPLIDFYLVWFGDTPLKIAKKLGIPLKVLIQYNPSLRWGYVVPGQRLIYPVSFPMAEEKSPQQNKTSQNNGTQTDQLIPSKSQTGNGGSNTPNKLQ